MKIKMIAVCLFAVSALFSVAGAQAPQNDAEKAVWSQEEAYWRYVKSGDDASFQKLWAAEFTGWPSGSAKPVGTGDIHTWKVDSYELEPFSVKQHAPDIVMTFYMAREKVGDKAENLRMTHTWKRIKGSWQIVGGMACVEPCGGTK